MRMAPLRGLLCLSASALVLLFGVAAKQTLSWWSDSSVYKEENLAIAGKSVEVVLLGDSITKRWTDPRWTKYGTARGFLGRGISGQNTFKMELRLADDVLALHPKYVIFMGGINDLKSGFYPGPLRSLAERVIEMNTAELISRMQKRGITVLLCSLTPVDDTSPFVGVPGTQQRVQHVNWWLKGYAASHRAVYVDFHRVMSNSRGGYRAGLSDDGLHPNRQGYDVMAAVLNESLGTAAAQSSLNKH